MLAFNIAWKLAMVLKGKASPSLLASYDAERSPIAKQIVKRARPREEVNAIVADRAEGDRAVRAANSSQLHKEPRCALSSFDPVPCCYIARG